MPSQQPPPERMTTRGVKVTIPEEIQKNTREELRERSLQKAAEKKVEQDRKKAEKEAKQQKLANGGKRIAALEDKQAVEQSELYSIRPDLNIKKNSPFITAGPKVNAVAESEADAFDQSEGSLASRGRGRGRGRGRSRGRGQGGLGSRGGHAPISAG
ncbi:hypothetical protein VKT23_000084 [Stygiomarasmius scandens]|uniref:Uncharacterized protein n=1 Tax=Marasmiellus scandens TaxID=2682957 RepID=A0ABR1K948_9AGAR